MRFSGGARGGISQVRIIRRFDAGFVGWGIKIKAYGDMREALLSRMTTQIYVGNDVAYLTANWRGKPGKWKITPGDFGR